MPRTKALAVLESGLLIPATAGIDMRTEQVVGNVVLANYRLAADSQPSYRVYGDGRQEWGAGGATAPDTNLYRTGTDTLATDDNFRSVDGHISVVSGVEPNPRVRMHKDAGGANLAGLLFGPGGATAPDVDLYRAGPDILATHDHMQLGGRLISVLDPINPQDGATKSYVDARTASSGSSKAFAMAVS